MVRKQEDRGPRIVAGQPHGPAAAITRRAADRLRAGHLWVYRSDIESLVPPVDAMEVNPGALITVMDSRGIPLGTGLYSSASQIAVRMVAVEASLTRPTYLQQMRQRVGVARALVRRPSLVFADKLVAGVHLRLLQCICHLLLHGFTFPTTSHIFILRVFRRVASHGLRIVVR